jgi:hypothetical protein
MDDDALFAPVELSWGEGREGTSDGGDSQPRVPEGHDDYPVHPQSVQRDDGGVTRNSDPSRPARRLEIRGFIDSGASHTLEMSAIRFIYFSYTLYILVSIR